MKLDKEKILSLSFISLSIIYLEVLTKLACLGSISPRGMVFTLLFSLSIGILLTAICSFFREKHFRRAIIAVIIVLCVVFAIQNVYYSIFSSFFSFYSFTEANNVLGSFWREAIEGIERSALLLLLIFLPAVAAVLLRRGFTGISGHKLSLKLLICAVLLHVGAVACVFIDNSGVMTPRYIYSDGFMPELSVRYFGVLTTERLDLRELLFKTENSIPPVIESPAPTPPPSPSTSPIIEPPEETAVVYEPNVLEIDFDSLIANAENESILNAHEYFASQEPTLKNEYSGMFEGKNLIWIVAEGFSDLAIDKEHTPTLYELSNSGFIFKNFYNPVWGVSTSDGEYITLTGLLPKAGVWSFTESADNDMGMTFGKMLGARGYDCRAYHNHTYTYYNRHQSHPNMGYNFIAVGNGLPEEKVWPASDLTMIQNSVDDYINAESFHTYYLTVSGHMYYTFNGNYQAYKHEQDVADLPYSSNARAYIACNMELDLAMRELLDRLEAAGRLDDTVIVLSGDHYPYGLTHEEFEELRGESVDNFELYRSTLIVWSGDMVEPIEVDKLCYSADIMPTLANLFGLEYDSRLLSGRDIFSTQPGFVVFSNRSFISELGRYDSTTDTFYENPDALVPNNYARDTLLGRVSDTFTYAAAILDLDYYSLVLPKSGNEEILRTQND